MLQERRAIQKNELLLQQKKEKLRIETELAKAVARESVYFCEGKLSFIIFVQTTANFYSSRNGRE